GLAGVGCAVGDRAEVVAQLVSGHGRRPAALVGSGVGRADVVAVGGPGLVVAGQGADAAVHVGVGEHQVLAVGAVEAHAAQRRDGRVERRDRGVADLDLGYVDLAVGRGHEPDVAGTAGLLRARVVDRVHAGRPGT